MRKSVNDVQALLGIVVVRHEKKKRMRAKDYAHDISEKTTNSDIQHKNLQASIPSEGEETKKPDSVDLKEFHEEASEELSDNSNEAHHPYTSRLATSSDEDSDAEASSADHTLENLQDPLSITEDSSAPSSPSSPKSRLPKRQAPSISTTFLPSLSRGGYLSGSESASDLADEEPQGRKNRMGQQARRALWEKKFGKDANHVKKQTESRDEGWDAKRGARAGDERGEKGRGRGRDREMVVGRGPKSSGANSDPVANKKVKRIVDAPLHPSWEAAKRAKEQKKAVAFQGKKVVFD